MAGWPRTNDGTIVHVAFEMSEIVDVEQQRKGTRIRSSSSKLCAIALRKELTDVICLLVEPKIGRIESIYVHPVSLC